MKYPLPCLPLLFAAALALASGAQAQAPASAPASEGKSDARRTSDAQQEKRAAEWAASLKLEDAAKTERVAALISTHLKAIRDWHNEHPFTTVPAGINPTTGRPLSDLDRQVIANSAMPKSIRQTLLAGLRAELTPEQVDAILDRYTIGKVEFTLRGYRAIVPDLTPAEEAALLGFLRQAREEAIDYKNMNQISTIFEIYKTKSEQYLNANGRDWKKLYQAYSDAARAKKAASAAVRETK